MIEEMLKNICLQERYMEAVIKMSEPDWEQRRYETARAAMAALLSHTRVVDNASYADLAETAVKIADAVVGKLQEQ